MDRSRPEVRATYMAKPEVKKRRSVQAAIRQKALVATSWDHQETYVQHYERLKQEAKARGDL